MGRGKSPWERGDVTPVLSPLPNWPFPLPYSADLVLDEGDEVVFGDADLLERVAVTSPM
ncbi:MAG: hypothetical protein O7B35_17080 [Deltaproteobacteria bacterium]|nr:hypothetical protein [Deltaproteobacteria bacterium]